jgi:hypothetical protein
MRPRWCDASDRFPSHAEHFELHGRESRLQAGQQQILLVTNIFGEQPNCSQK